MKTILVFRERAWFQFNETGERVLGIHAVDDQARTHQIKMTRLISTVAIEFEACLSGILIQLFSIRRGPSRRLHLERRKIVSSRARKMGIDPSRTIFFSCAPFYKLERIFVPHTYGRHCRYRP